MTQPRIAVGGFLHETNTFAPSPASYDDFVRGGGAPPLSEGDAVFAAVRDSNIGLSGFAAAAEARDWTLVPTLWCAATPSAQVSEDAFERIAGRMVEMIGAALPLDGVYLDLHGAMVAAHLDDGEGELLARVRATVGPDVPVIASLDLHGNVTAKMVDSADMLIAYRTYPHVDMAATGARCATAMARLLGGARRDAKAFRQLPFLIPIAWQCTAEEPCRGLYARLEAMEGETLPSLSFLPGFPAADFADCGPSVVVYGVDQSTAGAAADDLAAAVLATEEAFAGRVHSPEEGVREAMALADGAGRPVVIADTQDNPGAGGDSDTTGMLRALVALKARRAALGCLFDPQAAAAAHRAGVGAVIDVALGGKSGVPGDAPFEAAFTVEALADGRLTAPGPYYGGGRLDLGPSACLRIDDVRVVVTSRKAQMADQAMYRFVGIEPREQAILVNKSSVHFRADFAPIAATILVCAAPGPMHVDPATLPWTRLRAGVRTSPLGPVFEPTVHDDATA